MMTMTAEPIEAMADTAFPDRFPVRRKHPEPRVLPEPALSGLIWALCLGAGRIPLLP